MRGDLLRPALNGAAGFVVALACWLGLSGLYARLLARASQAVIHLSEWSSRTILTAHGTLIAVDRTDLPPAPSQFAIESTDLTFNLILLVTLFAACRRALSDRNVFGFAGAASLLFLVHVFAVVAFAKAHFALNFGEWSTDHYGTIARSFWGAAPYFYSVVGVYGFAFALWWLFRPGTFPSVDAPRSRPTRGHRTG